MAAAEISNSYVNGDFVTVDVPSHSPAHDVSDRTARTGRGMSLEWTNLSFRIGDKVILDNVSGSIQPGTLTAVLGPSGAGKSTLMNLLAGRQHHRRFDGTDADFKNTTLGKKEAVMSGIVSADGDHIAHLSHFRGNVAYVMQDDAFVAAVTPAEAIKFSAQLRKGESNKEALSNTVSSAITSLRLQSAQDTRIGDALRKGISGGEKKRTAIGVELVTCPKILFLDEPLSGLDSYAAFQTMQVLRRVAGRKVSQGATNVLGQVMDSVADSNELEESGATDKPSILLTVHQPSSLLMSMFDDVIILIPGGRVIYHGPVADISSFFLSEYNERCPDGTSPTDFITFLVQAYQLSQPQKLQEMADKWARYSEDKLRPQIESVRSTASNKPSSHSKALAATGKQKRTTGFFTQLAALTNREAVETKRRPIAKVIGFFISAFLAAVYGAVYWQVGDVIDDLAEHHSAHPDWVGPLPTELTQKLTAYYGAMVVLCISTMMGSSQALLLTFPLQRAIFLREYATNMYSVPAYFISKMLVELPVGFLNALGQMVVAYWMMGLRGNFFYETCVLWLLGTASASTCLMVSSAFADPRGAAQALVLVQVPQMLFSGLFLAVALIPLALRWMQYLSFLKYGINLFFIVEVGDALPQIADSNDIESAEVALYCGIIAAIAIFARVLAMLLLKSKAAYVF